MTSFLDALTPLVDALVALDVPYYLGGSVASIAHGVARPFQLTSAEDLGIGDLLEQALSDAGLVRK